jgi:hypothetical protein
MNARTISRVVKRANELIARSDTALADTESHTGYIIVGTKATGALRRTSMELTRALADLRRPG